MNTSPTYEERVVEVLRRLGIPASYAQDKKLPIQPEAKELVSVGMDIYGREQKLAPLAAKAWEGLHQSAAKDGVSLQMVSAFRSLDYQSQLWERKLASGKLLEQIMRVNAAPGYSEHHTGRAIDLTTSGCVPLSEEFELTPAFAWLVANARRFGFMMSYPRNNPYGLVYEPWHWSKIELPK